MPPATRRGGVRPQRCTGTEQCICAFCADAQGGAVSERAPAGNSMAAGGDSAGEARQAGSTGSASAEQQPRRIRGAGWTGQHSGEQGFGPHSTAARRQLMPSLVNLCLFRIALELPDLLAEDVGAGEGEGGESALSAFCFYASLLPTSVKQTLAALARRQHVLTDEFLVNGVLDSTWRVLDLSDSAASDAALAAASRECPALEAVSVRNCEAVSAAAILALLKACPNIEHLRLGGSEACNRVARQTVRAVLRGLLPPPTSQAPGTKCAGGQSLHDSLPSPLDATSLARPACQGEAAIQSAQDALQSLSMRNETDAEASVTACPPSSQGVASMGPSCGSWPITAASVPQDGQVGDGGDSGWEAMARDEGIRGIAPALRTLDWPEVDYRSESELALRCPRIRVNPSSTVGSAAVPALRAQTLPGSFPAALELDGEFVAELDDQVPALSALGLLGPRAPPGHLLSEVHAPAEERGPPRRESIAERFRLAYVEREQRLAPKRAKNTRQRMRKEAQEMLAKSPWAKARYWASRVHTQA